MIDLYTYGTINGRAVVIAAEATGLSYQLNLVDLAIGENRSSAFIDINPSGRIPAMVDTGFDPHLKISQTCTILIYLAEKAGKFLSEDLKVRTKTMQWLHFIATDIATNLFNNFYLKALVSAKQPEAATKLKKRAINFCQEIEVQLAKSEYLVGNELSIADMYAIPMIEYLKTEIVTEENSHISRWHKQMQAYEFVRKGLSI